MAVCEFTMFFFFVFFRFVDVLKLLHVVSTHAVQSVATLSGYHQQPQSLHVLNNTGTLL